MAWSDEPTDRTHGPYNLKVVLTVYNPSVTTAEAATFLADTLLAAGEANVKRLLRL